MPSQEVIDFFVPIGLDSFNTAVLLGLTATQLQNATGIENLAQTVEALSVSTDQSDARYRAAKGIRAAGNAGIYSDTNVQNATALNDIRAYFTALKPDLSSTFTGGGFLA